MLVVESNWLVILIQLLIAKWQNDFWSTLNDDADIVLKFSIESVGDGSSLAEGAEWDLGLELIVALSVDESILDCDLLINEHLQKTDVNWAANWLEVVLSHLHLGISVKNKAVLEHIEHLSIDFWVIYLHRLLEQVEVSNSHVAGGQSGGLASKDINEHS